MIQHRVIKPDDDLPLFSTPLAGVDEAGRGPLAGPVAVAAVILDPKAPIVGLNDSKKLSEKRRNELATQIKQHALSWSIELCPAEVIDKENIFQATLNSMARCVHNLEITPQRIAVDGKFCPQQLESAIAIIKGDARVAEISAASILAKVERDQYMYNLHQQYPDYGFDRHKGYPTKLHKEMLKLHGPCKEHRKSYAPVKETLSNAEFANNN
ncbi:MAG: ribonuclease HII [bacterium]